MSASNALENAIGKMLLQGVDPSWRAGATAYLALVTLATPDEAAPVASEVTYTGYARVAITKSTFWTDGGSTFTNAALVQWGKRTDAGAVQTAQAFVIVDTASGAINMGMIGALAAPLAISQNIKPQADPGDLSVTFE